MILTGRARARDELGRFASSGFDGGARQPAPFRQAPEVEHNTTLIDSMRSSVEAGGSDVGARF
jgi:hypothetical protein